MLILLGGFLGSGRAFLARKLAQQLEFHYCDINDYKMRTYFIGADRLVHEHTQEPLNDKTRLLLYERVAKDLPLLSKMYSGVVMDTSFHRLKPREYFFDEARKHFNKVIFVWVDSDERQTRRIVDRMAEHGVVRSVPKTLRRQRDIRKRFQPFPFPPTVFHYDGTGKKSITRLRALVEVTAPI